MPKYVQGPWRPSCGPNSIPTSLYRADPPATWEPLPADHPLAQEWEFYKQHLEGWVADGLEQKFVLIKGRELIGIFETAEQAREAGARRFLLDPFFMKQIWLQEPVLTGIRGIDRPWPVKILEDECLD